VIAVFHVSQVGLQAAQVPSLRLRGIAGELIGA
jgi:hypothetical protein